MIRLHLVNKQTIIGIPLGILAFVLLVNIAIWWIISTSVADARRSGRGTEWPAVERGGLLSVRLRDGDRE